jgi:uncharacterized protein YjbI with pentapeptide repeats
MIAHFQSLKPNEIQSYVQAVCGSDWRGYYKTIQETYNLQALAQRPILLQMITEVLPELAKKGQDITSARLYSQYTDLWLRRDDWRTSLGHKDRLKFTVAFARAMYEENATSFTWTEVEKAVAARFPTSSPKEREYFQYDIRTCTFIRRDPSTNEYEFVHESFLEFFVATSLYEDLIHNRHEALTERVHTPEVLQFLGEHSATEQAVRHLVAELRHTVSPALVANGLAVLGCWRVQMARLFIRGMTVAGVRLNGLGLQNVKLTDSALKDLTLSDTTWQECYFDGVLAERLEGRGATFEDVTIEGGSTEDSMLRDCAFTRVAWERSRLASEFHKCRFVECVFADTQLKSTRFVECTFDRCDLTNASLEGCRFEGCNLINNQWSAQALEGLVIQGGMIKDGGPRPLKPLVTRMPGDKRRVRRDTWRIPPKIAGLNGLAVDVRALLRGQQGT